MTDHGQQGQSDKDHSQEGTLTPEQHNHYAAHYHSIWKVLTRKEHGFFPHDYIPYIEELTAEIEALTGKSGAEQRQWEDLLRLAKHCNDVTRAGERDAQTLLTWREQQPEISTSAHYYTIWSWGLEYGWPLAVKRLRIEPDNPERNIYQEWYSNGYTQTWREAGYLEDRTMPNPFADEQGWRDLVASELARHQTTIHFK